MLDLLRYADLIGSIRVFVANSDLECGRRIVGLSLHLAPCSVNVSGASVHQQGPESGRRASDVLAACPSSDLRQFVAGPGMPGTCRYCTVCLRAVLSLQRDSEKSNRDAVKRAYAQLSARTRGSVVFNKSRSRGPKWLDVENGFAVNSKAEIA